MIRRKECSIDNRPEREGWAPDGPTQTMGKIYKMRNVTDGKPRSRRFGTGDSLTSYTMQSIDDKPREEDFAIGRIRKQRSQNAIRFPGTSKDGSDVDQRTDSVKTKSSITPLSTIPRRSSRGSRARNSMEVSKFVATFSRSYTDRAD
jgi:hypothetical protein